MYSSRSRSVAHASSWWQRGKKRLALNWACTALWHELLLKADVSGSGGKIRVHDGRWLGKDLDCKAWFHFESIECCSNVYILLWNKATSTYFFVKRNQSNGNGKSSKAHYHRVRFTDCFSIKERQMSHFLRRYSSFKLCHKEKRLSEIRNGRVYRLAEKGTSFSILDASFGPWLIKINDKNSDKTTFATHNGLFRYTGMPFGLKITSALF